MTVLDSRGTSSSSHDDARRFWTVAAALAVLKLALHLALIGRFDYHRDELYFIACGRRLAFGYVDHPPLVPWIARLAGVLFDHSLFGLRVLPALAGAATVVLAALVVRDLGGGPRAALVAGLSVIAAPAYMRMSTILCIPVFEAPLWTLASLLVLRRLGGGRRSLWIAVGIVVGVGLLNKHSMLLWIAGTGAGLALTRARRELASPMPWIGLLVAFAIFAPNLAWQARHDWATVTFLRGMSEGVLARVPRALFLLGQLLFMNPLTIPVWIVGLVSALRHERTRPLGVGFLVIVAALLLTHGKPYYLAPAYPVLFAIGAVAIERWAAARRRAWPVPVLGASLCIAAVALGLHPLPLLPVEALDRATSAVSGGRIRPEDLSRELHDEFGWREQALVVERVVASLPAEERARTLVLAGNYGEAAAIEFFAARDLHVASGHLSYWFWGFDDRRGETVVAYGFRRTTLERFFAEVTEVARVDHPTAISDERDLPVYVCRAPRVPLADAWPELRRSTN